MLAHPCTAAFQSEHERRILAIIRRVAAEETCALIAGGRSTGMPRPVIRDDGQQWPSVSAAARDARVKPDWICQSIKRRGTCGGHGWAYIDEIPDGFFVGIKAGAACPWPYAFGNPILYPEAEGV